LKHNSKGPRSVHLGKVKWDGGQEIKIVVLMVAVAMKMNVAAKHGIGCCCTNTSGTAAIAPLT
jgi:hypothetical protein